MGICESLQAPDKPTRKRFDLPSDSQLFTIVNDIYGCLPFNILTKATAYVTGSAALNRLGAIKRQLKDIDIVLVVDLDEAQFEVYKEQIKTALFTLPEAKDCYYAPIEDIEMQTRVEINGYRVEIFLRTKGEKTLDVALSTGQVIKFALIDSVFSKKWTFNKDKAERDIYNIRDYLSQWKPKEPTLEG